MQPFSFTHQTEGQATQDPRLHTPHTGGTNYQNDSPVQVSVREGSEERQLNRKLGPQTTQTPPRHAKLLRYRKFHNYVSVNFGPERLGGSQGTTTTCTCMICAATLWAKTNWSHAHISSSHYGQRNKSGSTSAGMGAPISFRVHVWRAPIHLASR